LSKVTLNNGVLMPLMGFGTWKAKGEEAYEACYHALDNGYKLIDTATCYGNEKEVA
jgi:diketogulonate reductase-like aldo/keto reductase